MGKIIKEKKNIFLLGAVFLFSFAVFNDAKATTLEFNVDPSYDYIGRSKISTFLYQIGENAYFYVEDEFYQNLDAEKKQAFADAVKNLSQEFDSAIYPKLTGLFGSEWNPGIDKDSKITVLITRMKESAAGYFNEGDEYSKSQVPVSNEREMVYIGADYVTSPLAKNFLAHEFIHLITFNQKDKSYGISEETWLNEGRAEAAPTILGYDVDYANSLLPKRVEAFSQKPKDSLTEWRDLPADYGILNLFIQYVLDHYGQKILIDSLRSNKTGILSLNYALAKNGYPEDFSQIFTNWSITILVNNCNLGLKYCYLNPVLKNIRVTSQINYLPLGNESTLSVSDYTKSWSGSWIKFIGGKGTLKFEFIGDPNVKFKVPYLKQDSFGNYSVDFLSLNGNQSGIVYIPDFGDKINSFIVIPSVQHKIAGFTDAEPFYKFIWSASVINQNPAQEEENAVLVAKLLTQIEFLKNEIARLKTQIDAILNKGQGGSAASCQKIENDLYYGIQNKNEVSCLQDFLKKQGAAIYPEGLVTGNFGRLTESAVIRFQEKYVVDVLFPLGLNKGTGFVGQLTRAKINALFNQ